jgi:hypothetical protein
MAKNRPLLLWVGLPGLLMSICLVCVLCFLQRKRFYLYMVTRNPSKTVWLKKLLEANNTKSVLEGVTLEETKGDLETYSIKPCLFNPGTNKSNSEDVYLLRFHTYSGKHATGFGSIFYSWVFDRRGELLVADYDSWPSFYRKGVCLYIDGKKSVSMGVSLILTGMVFSKKYSLLMIEMTMDAWHGG